MAKIKLIAPDGQKLRDVKSLREYKEVIIDERRKDDFALVGGQGDPEMETVEGVTITERVNDLESAVVELAELYAEQDDAIVELAELVGGEE